MQYKGIVLPYSYEEFKKYPVFPKVYPYIKELLENNQSDSERSDTIYDGAELVYADGNLTNAVKQAKGKYKSQSVFRKSNRTQKSKLPLKV